MVNTNDLQRAYINLYKELRRYIWSYEAVRALALLETAVYERFPDMNDVKRYFHMFKLYKNSVTYGDEDLDKAFAKFESVIEDADTIYSNLPQVEEVISV